MARKEFVAILAGIVDTAASHSDSNEAGQEIRGSVGEGPAVSLSGTSECAVGKSPTGSISPSTDYLHSKPDLLTNLDSNARPDNTDAG
jgi:hypothetical protein